MGDPPGGGEAAEPYPLGIGGENWAVAERAAEDIIRKVQPTSVSEERRGEVVDYIQRLIMNGLNVEVFPFGSVPLKTYLPDGDIDLTAFGGANVEDALADDIKHVLEQEEKILDSEFVVKDVQLIRAEVKLVKCIVQDIVVDLSFNQIGGLCTLCFLEQVDQLIGKDHLFKRSIILIKAWCYYESRILGAHHGLISTYALETLVLYVFQFFHSTLDGPLAVLYKFLDYFSAFDWETYCVSLNGPLRLSSLPDIVVDMPEDCNKSLLLSNDFLSMCVGLFSFPSRVSDKNPRGFQHKYLNIVDPLKEINNLGRSVSKGSFYRIRSAFSYGATKLTQILLQPENTISSELHKFFSNTMARHGGGQWPDIQGFEPSLASKRPTSELPIPDHSHEYDEDSESRGDFQSRSGKLSQDSLKWPERTPSDIAASTEPSKPNILGSFHSDSNDLTTFSFEGLKISTDSSSFGTPHLKESPCAVDVPYYAHDSKFISCNGSIEIGQSDSDKVDDCEKEKNASYPVLPGSTSSKSKAVSLAPHTSSFSVDTTRMDLEQGSSARSEASESLTTSDLTGNYHRFFHWLQYGRWCYEYEYGLNMHALPMPPPLPTTLWDGHLSPSHVEQNGFSHHHYNGLHPSPPVYVLQPMLLPGVAFRLDEVAKPRGTGTYFPYMAQPPSGYRSSSIKGRNQASLRSPRHNGQNMIFAEPNAGDRSSNETSQPQVPVHRNMMAAHIDNHPTLSPRGGRFPETNGTSIQPRSVVEYGLVGQSSGSPMSEKGRQQKPGPPLSPRNSSALSREQDG